MNVAFSSWEWNSSFDLRRSIKNVYVHTLHCSSRRLFHPFHLISTRPLCLCNHPKQPLKVLPWYTLIQVWNSHSDAFPLLFHRHYISRSLFFLSLQFFLSKTEVSAL